MKYFLPIMIFVVAFASCKQENQEASDRKIELLVDSTVYQNNTVYTDTVAVAKQEPATIPQVSQQTHYVKPKTQRVTRPQPPAAIPAPPVTQQQKVETLPPVATAPTETTQTAGNGNTLPDAGVPGQAKEQKKGWSKAAQGAVIGGAAGAVGGAIISKKKGLGAVVGGVVGAAGGYIIGKNKDKKETEKQ